MVSRLIKLLNRGRDRELKNVIAYLKDQINTTKPIAEAVPVQLWNTGMRMN